MRKTLLITGCGRSGTKYATFVLRRLGLDVRHEKMGEDGVASWFMAVDAKTVPFGDASRNFVFNHVFHQVRHPLTVIPSVASFKEDTWRFVCAHAPIDINERLLLRCAKYWYYWNLNAEKIADWRYRIEDFETVFNPFCERLGVVPDTRVLEQISRDVNTRKLGWAFHVYEELCNRLGQTPKPLIKRWLSVNKNRDGQHPMSWNSLQLLDGELTENIRRKALDYGYTT